MTGSRLKPAATLVPPLAWRCASSRGLMKISSRAARCQWRVLTLLRQNSPPNRNTPSAFGLVEERRKIKYDERTKLPYQPDDD